jgi:hypothetical protein
MRLRRSAAASSNLCGRSPPAHLREILGRQCCEREARASRAQGDLALVARGLEADLAAVGQLAHDVVERMRRHRRGARLADLARNGLDDREVHVGRGERDLFLAGVEQHVREDRDGVAPFDDALDMREPLEQGGTFDRELHGPSFFKIVLGWARWPRFSTTGPRRRGPEKSCRRR